MGCTDCGDVIIVTMDHGGLQSGQHRRAAVV